MLKSSAIIGFVATRQPELARKFYEQTLGLRLTEDGPYALVFDANGTMLRVQKVHELSPASHTALGWCVEDIHAVVKALTEQGVHFEHFPGLRQDEQGVW